MADKAVWRRAKPYEIKAAFGYFNVPALALAAYFE
jgi:hypothetical protein